MNMIFSRLNTAIWGVLGLFSLSLSFKSSEWWICIAMAFACLLMHQIIRWVATGVFFWWES